VTHCGDDGLLFCSLNSTSIKRLARLQLALV